MGYNYNVHIEELIEKVFVLVYVKAKHGSYFLGVFYDVEGLYYYSPDRPNFDMEQLHTTIDVMDYEEITYSMDEIQLDIFLGALSICNLYLETEKPLSAPSSITLEEQEQPQQRQQHEE
jgi:hypothetical protein